METKISRVDRACNYKWPTYLVSVNNQTLGIVWLEYPLPGRWYAKKENALTETIDFTTRSEAINYLGGDGDFQTLIVNEENPTENFFNGE